MEGGVICGLRSWDGISDAYRIDSLFLDLDIDSGGLACLLLAKEWALYIHLDCIDSSHLNLMDTDTNSKCL